MKRDNDLLTFHQWLNHYKGLNRVTFQQLPRDERESYKQEYCTWLSEGLVENFKEEIIN